MSARTGDIKNAGPKGAGAFLREYLAMVLAFLAFLGLVAALACLAAMMGLTSPRTTASAVAQSAYPQLAYENFVDRTETLLEERGLPGDLAIPAFDETAFYRDSANSLKASLSGKLRLPETAEGQTQATEAILAILQAEGVPLTDELTASVDETAALIAGTYREGTSFEFGLAWHDASDRLRSVARILLPASAALALLAALLLLVLLPRREALRHLAYALLPAGPALLGLGALLWTLVRPESLSASFAYQQFASRFLELALIPVLGLAALALAAGALLAAFTRRAGKEAR